MSYLVLARKYRPKTFGEVVGQEVVTRILAGALEEDRLGHAYLFAGPRGTGKTTIARILAKCLNCEEGPTPTPCGTCERCLGADGGTEVDIVELDAASHTGVDTIRELRDEVAYAPMRARSKVYIVDEVHMLSKGAFNALLKTLEEPPPHVVFLFATTEPHKVLDTILSRCQVLKLRPLSEKEIAGRLDEVLGLEDIRPAEGVTVELARAAGGGMRDALSLADKLIALAGDEPGLDDVARLGEDGGARAVESLLSAVEAGERTALFEELETFAGGEAELAVALLERLRTALLVRHCGEDTPLAGGGETERRAAAERAERLGPERIELWMQELLRARERMRLFPGEERVVLEVCLLDLVRGEGTVPVAELLARLEALEARGALDAGTPAAPAARAGTPRGGGGQDAPARKGELRPARAPSAPAAREELAPQDAWEPFLARLAEGQRALADLLREHASLEPGEGPDALRLRVRVRSDGERKLLEGKRAAGACARALSGALGREVRLEVVVDERPRAGGGKGAPTAERPAGTRAKGEAGEEKRTKDTFTHEVADLFGGVVEDLP